MNIYDANSCAISQLGNERTRERERILFIEMINIVMANKLGNNVHKLSESDLKQVFSVSKKSLTISSIAKRHFLRLI